VLNERLPPPNKLLSAISSQHHPPLSPYSPFSVIPSPVQEEHGNAFPYYLLQTNPPNMVRHPRSLSINTLSPTNLIPISAARSPLPTLAKPLTSPSTGLLRRLGRPRLYLQVQRAEAGQDASLHHLQDQRRLERNCRRRDVHRPRLRRLPRETHQRKEQGPPRQ
jgi:hypothetical protein